MKKSIQLFEIMKSEGSTPCVVTGAPESDCHVVGLKLLEFSLKSKGFEIHNLGACTSCAEFVEKAQACQPLAVVISAMNGQALNDLAGLRDQLEQAGLGQLPIYIGGNLSVGSQKDPVAIDAAFAAIGIKVLQTFEEVADELGRLAEAAGRPTTRQWG